MKLLSTAAAAAFAVSLTFATGASAVPFNGPVNVSVYASSSLSGGNAGSGGTGTQALPSAIAPNGGPLTFRNSFLYTGALNFVAPSDPVTEINFFGSGGGSVSGGSLLPGSFSSGGFNDATVIKLTFTLTNFVSGNILHDDGISLYNGGTTTGNLLPGNSAPTSVASTPFVNLGPGTYDLYYSEVNGAPAQLTFDITRVPEPASMALMGVGLLGVGLGRRWRKRRG